MRDRPLSEQSEEATEPMLPGGGDARERRGGTERAAATPAGRSSRADAAGQEVQDGSEQFQAETERLRASDAAERIAAADNLLRMVSGGEVTTVEALSPVHEAYRRERDVAVATRLLSAANQLRMLGGTANPGVSVLQPQDARETGRASDRVRALDAKRAEALLNQHLRGRYRIERQVAATRMSVVYFGWRASDGRRVALKCLPESLLSSGARAEFNRETRLMMQVRHPHVVSVLDRGLAGEMPFVVMEWVEGGTLRDLAGRRRAPVHRVLRIGREVCDGLAHVHGKGVLHLDIKPGNVLLGASDNAKLTDFGIVRHLGDEHAGTVMAGTPKYAAPEQLQQGGHVDERSDVYSLGVVLYLLLTGDLPEETSRPLNSLNPAVPEAIDPVLLKALRRDPEQRFADAASFGKALAECLPRYMNEGDTDVNTLQGGLR